MNNGNKSPNETTRMINRSPSRRQRRESRAVIPEGIHSGSAGLGRKMNNSPPYSRRVEFATSSPPQKKKELPNIPTNYGRKYRRASIAVGADEAGVSEHLRISRNSISTMNHFMGHGITVTSPTEDDIDGGDHMPEHKTVDDKHPVGATVISMESSPRYKRHLSSEIPLHARTHRNSLTPETVNRSPSFAPDVLHNKSPRHSLIPDVLGERSPRNSITPENAVYLKSPRGSFSLNPENECSGPLGSHGEGIRSSSYNLAPDVHSYSRSPRNSLIPDCNSMRSPRGSIIPESALSPRGSIAVDSNRSPRGSLIPESMHHHNRSPRGSIASETSHNRSPRNSLPLQESGAKRSPRGSITPTSMVQFDSSTKSPRRSVDYAGGSLRPMSRTGSVGKSRKPREETVDLHEIETTASPTPRRASSSVSQVGVSADDRRRLCEQSKLNSESSGIGHAAYGSLTYQLEHATMESSNPFQFVYKALCIFYRTIFCSIILGSLVLLSALMLIMGMNYKKDCPKEPRIVYYLIIGGITGLFETVLLLVRQIKSLRYDHSVQVHDMNPCSTDNVKTYSIICLTLFCIFGFILGNTYIYSIFWPEFSGTLFDPNRWCHRTLYIFCIAHMVIVYIYALFLTLFTVGLFFMQVFCPLWIRK